MKIDCPSCGQTFEGETELAASLALVAHVKDSQDEDHIIKTQAVMDDLDRSIAFAALMVDDDREIKTAIYDKCVGLNMRLRTVQLYAVAHLSRAFRMIQDMLIECREQSSIRDMNAGTELRENLREALLVAERKYK